MRGTKIARLADLCVWDDTELSRVVSAVIFVYDETTGYDESFS